MIKALFHLMIIATPLVLTGCVSTGGGKRSFTQEDVEREVARMLEPGSTKIPTYQGFITWRENGEGGYDIYANTKPVGATFSRINDLSYVSKYIFGKTTVLLFDAYGYKRNCDVVFPILVMNEDGFKAYSDAWGNCNNNYSYKMIGKDTLQLVQKAYKGAPATEFIYRDFTFTQLKPRNPIAQYVNTNPNTLQRTVRNVVRVKQASPKKVVNSESISPAREKHSSPKISQPSVDLSTKNKSSEGRDALDDLLN